MTDAIVIGAGPNGLAAANRLADAGLDVLVCEQHPTRIGGACASESGADAGTVPGAIHDVGAAFFPFSQASPAFRALDLGRWGLEWVRAPVQSCHPAPDGSTVAISIDDDRTAASFGGRDGDAWRRLIRWHREAEQRLIEALLGPLPGIGPKLKLLPFDALRFAAIALSSTAGFSKRLFRSEAARRVMPGLALHVDLGPDDAFGAALGYFLGTTAATCGNAIPVGGAGAITGAMARRLEGNGGHVQLGASVVRIVTEGRAVRAVVLADGTEIETRLVLADTGAPALFLKLLPEDAVPARIRRAMGRFRRGWGAFKVDWVLDGPVPWLSAEAREAAVVHAGDDVADLRRFTRTVRAGHLPENPYLVIGQQSLADPGRAPTGQHTLWAYSRVPPQVDGGWVAHREVFADAIDARIEGLAPGFRDRIIARRIVAPPDLEAFDPNLVGGDLGGGSNHWRNQLFFRPVFPHFRYRTPVRGAFLSSSYAHPGAGVHGMAGWNAAGAALRTL